MRRAPRLPDLGAGALLHLRVFGSLLQPATPAFLAGLPLTDGVRASAGRYLTLSSLHEIGATPRTRSATRWVTRWRSRICLFETLRVDMAMSFLADSTRPLQAMRSSGGRGQTTGSALPR